MSQSFQQKYGKRVRDFCKSVPPELNVTTEELDVYFRSCALYLWAHSEFLTNGFNKINRVYTDSPANLTHQEYDDQINLYRSNPGETIGVPDFFLRMLAYDTDSGTDHSRRFIDVQSEVLAMCRDYGGVYSASSLSIRRMLWMREQLVIICDQAKIGDCSPDESEILIDQEDIEEVKDIVASVNDLMASAEFMCSSEEE